VLISNKLKKKPAPCCSHEAVIYVGDDEEQLSVGSGRLSEKQIPRRLKPPRDDQKIRILATRLSTVPYESLFFSSLVGLQPAGEMLFSPSPQPLQACIEMRTNGCA
jgi:hypothetical protein